METLLDIADVKRELRARGLTIAGWAASQGFTTQQVYALLNGRTRGNWGVSHQVAIALGLKPAPEPSKRFSHLDYSASRDENAPNSQEPENLSKGN